MEENETKIAPPSSPLTAKINLAILGFYFDHFVKKYLPAYKADITSGYRTADKNAEVGGAQNSAHLHGLAYDFVLRFQNGELVPRPQAKKVFDDFIAPNWPGFALWEEDHVHVNLSRQITEYAAIMGVAAMGVVGFHLLKALNGGSKHG